MQETIRRPRHGGDRGNAESLVNGGTLGVVNTCDDAFDAESLACDSRCDDVGIVSRGHRGKGVGPLDSRPDQHVTVEPHSQNLGSREVEIETQKRTLIAVDDGDLMSDPGQRRGEGRTHSTAPHDDDIHALLRSWTLMARLHAESNGTAPHGKSKYNGRSRAGCHDKR